VLIVAFGRKILCYSFHGLARCCCRAFAGNSRQPRIVAAMPRRIVSKALLERQSIGPFHVINGNIIAPQVHLGGNIVSDTMSFTSRSLQVSSSNQVTSLDEGCEFRILLDAEEHHVEIQLETELRLSDRKSLYLNEKTRQTGLHGRKAEGLCVATRRLALTSLWTRGCSFRDSTISFGHLNTAMLEVIAAGVISRLIAPTVFHVPTTPLPFNNIKPSDPSFISLDFAIPAQTAENNADNNFPTNSAPAGEPRQRTQNSLVGERKGASEDANFSCLCAGVEVEMEEEVFRILYRDVYVYRYPTGVPSCFGCFRSDNNTSDILLGVWILFSVLIYYISYRYPFFYQVRTRSRDRGLY
jgi:hypothetical protein